jgi:hypothetical protein
VANFLNLAAGNRSTCALRSFQVRKTPVLRPLPPRRTSRTRSSRGCSARLPERLTAQEDERAYRSLPGTRQHAGCRATLAATLFTSFLKSIHFPSLQIVLWRSSSQDLVSFLHRNHICFCATGHPKSTVTVKVLSSQALGRGNFLADKLKILYGSGSQSRL